MPVLEMIVRRRQFIMARVKKIFKHPEQIEIHEVRAIPQQKWMVRHHFLERHQTLLQPLQPLALLFAPLVNAAAAELALLEPQKIELLRRRHVFLPVNVVEPETPRLQFHSRCSAREWIGRLRVRTGTGRVEISHQDIWR